jgi:preprotein translocase subunit SecD
MIGRVALLAAASTVLLGGCQLLMLGSAGPVACVTLQVGPVEGVAVDDGELVATQAVIAQRLDALGARNTSYAVVHPDQHLIVGLPSGDAERWRRAMTQPGELTFVPVPPEHSLQITDGQTLPAGMDPTPLFDGAGVVDAEVSPDELGRPSVSLSLDAEAAAIFDAYAADHFGERFAMVLDGIVLSAPSINATRFNGQAQISGNFTEEEAEDLVAALRSGPLPVPVAELGVAAPVGGDC